MDIRATCFATSYRLDWFVLDIDLFGILAVFFNMKKKISLSAHLKAHKANYRLRSTGDQLFAPQEVILLILANLLPWDMTGFAFACKDFYVCYAKHLWLSYAGLSPLILTCLAKSSPYRTIVPPLPCQTYETEQRTLYTSAIRLNALLRSSALIALLTFLVRLFPLTSEDRVVSEIWTIAIVRKELKVLEWLHKNLPINADHCHQALDHMCAYCRQSTGLSAPPNRQISLPIAHFLLDHGALPTYSIMSEAIKLDECPNNLNFLQLLINANGSVNFNDTQPSLLYYCATSYRADHDLVLKLLITNGAPLPGNKDYRQRDENACIIYDSINSRNPKCAMTLLQCDVAPKSLWNCLCMAMDSDLLDPIRFLIRRYKVDVNVFTGPQNHGLDPENIVNLLTAAIMKHTSLEIIQFLFDCGVDPNAMGGMAMQHSCERGKLEMVKLLVHNGGALSHCFPDPYETLVNNGFDDMYEYDKFEVCKLLVDAKADVQFNHNRLLHTAINYLDYEDVQFLLNAKADPNAVSVSSGTIFPIVSAYDRRHFHTCKCLLQAKADVHVCYDYLIRQTSMQESLAGDDVYDGFFKFLIDSKADVNANDGEPLINVCSHGFCEAAKLLLANGANARVRGDLALSYAAIHDKPKVNDLDSSLIMHLIRRNANPISGNSLALRNAVELGNRSTARLLRRLIEERTKLF
jgi:ankyrin repeat protein